MLDNLTLPSVPDTVKERIYDDALHPAAKEGGKALETIMLIINKFASPFRTWATKGKENTEKLAEEVQQRLASIPPENIIEPKSEIAVPAIMANSYTSSDDLRSLYANLLAKSMDKTERSAHPSYVEIIKQLSSDEALLLKSTLLLKKSIPICSLRCQKPSKFYNADKLTLHPQNIIRAFTEGYDLLPYYIPQITLFSPDELSIMIDNLLRLKLIELPYDQYLTAKDSYIIFYKDAFVTDIQNSLETDEASEGFELAHIMKMISPTPYGRMFYNVCVN